MELHGVIPPVVTPMRADEELDLPRLRELIERLLAHRVSGVFVLGTTGECYALDEAEKEAVMRTAVECVAGRVPVLAGTGAPTTREAVRLSRLARRCGADAVSVVTPYYVSPTQAELVGHFRRVAESAGLPVVLYSNPSTCGGVRIEAETAARLAEVPGVVGMKDSTGDLQLLAETLRLVPDSFALFQGRDTLMAAALWLGVRGAVPASSNVAPAWCVDIYEAARRGDWDAARAAQAKLSPVRLALTLGTQPGVVKAAMACLREPCDAGPSRAPVGPLPADKVAQLRAVLAEAGL